MNVTITPHPLTGEIRAIASKSQAHRLLICAALGTTPVRLICSESSQDIDATVRCLQGLGAKIHADGKGFTVHPIQTVANGSVLDCGESGSTLRFLLPVVGALGAKVEFQLSGRLPQRPLSPLWEELTAHGMTLSRPCPDRIACEGKLRGGMFTVAGNISSQFISGLLFALPVLQEDSCVIITGDFQSRQYVEMTRSALAQFGVHIRQTADEFTIAKDCQYHLPSSSGPLLVEGDWSNAAFWLCAGGLSGPLACSGLDLESLQGDRRVVEALRQFGASVTAEHQRVAVKPSPMKGVFIDAGEIPDLVPILAVCACGAQGETVIGNAGRLRIKESDRLQTVSDMLSALGASISQTEDGLRIVGTGSLRGGAAVDAAGDHRIAMSAAIASVLCREPICVCGAQAVKKSYPRFWEDFTALGGQIERSGSDWAVCSEKY